MNVGSTHEIALLERTLATLVSRTGLPVAFGGFAAPTGTTLSSFAGTRTGSLNGLVIKPGQGLGGLALARRQLAATGSYQESPDIIHSYDHEVAVEGILTLLAVPVVVDDQVRALIYAGLRDRSRLELDILGHAEEAARRLAWELSVHEETQRRVALLTANGSLSSQTANALHDRLELSTLYAELRDIAKQITDPTLAARITSASALLRPQSKATPTPTSELSPREQDVLSHLALGKRNALIGAHLGLAESTVKSYLASAIRKLEATNRFDVVLIARSRGLIP